MKSDVVEVSETKKNLVIEIPADEVNAEIDRVTRQYSRAARLPGFRPGKVPPKVVKQRFREEILHEVAHELVPRAVGEVLRERGLEPVAAPDVPHVHVHEGEALSFTATIETVPPVDPGDPAEIELRREPATVTDDAVAQTLERLRQRAARFEPIEGRGVETGDTVVLDLDRRRVEDGTPGPSERHENVSVETGAAVNPPGFDEELAGLQPGDRKTFRVRYPADYPVTDLASAEIEYDVTVKALRRRVVPELDDDLAKEVSDAETLEKLREQVREGLAREAGRASDRKLRADLLEALGRKVSFPLPEALVERELDRRTEEFVRQLFEQGVDPRQAAIDWEAFRREQREPAEQSVRATIVLDEVARREQLAVDDEDLSREVASYAERSGRTPAAVRAQLEKDGDLERLRTGLRRERTVDFLMSRVTITGD